MWIRSSDSHKRLARVQANGTNYTGPIVISAATESLVEIIFYNWLVLCNILLGQNSKWGFLLYNLVNCVFHTIRVKGIRWEHAFYLHNPRGNMTLIECTVEDVGAQGLQVTYRDPEGDVPEGWREVGTHMVVRSIFSKCGQPRGYGRASFALSFFGRQEGGGSTPRKRWDCPVVLEDVQILNDSDSGTYVWVVDPNSGAGSWKFQQTYELRGALLVEHRPSLTVLGGRTAYKGFSDRDLWHIYKVDDVLVENHDFVGPAGKSVDIDGARSVIFRNCTGTVPVRINGVKVGIVSDNINWSA